MTPTKDTLETGNVPVDSRASQEKSRSKPESPHLRADAVSLEIPVRVHGTIVPNLSAGASPQAQPFEEQTTTMIVFPQGGVLKMSTNVGAGQVMVLTNLKSRQDAICRVLKVRAYGKTQSYVEVEFTSPQPGYWGVYFPTDDSEDARGEQPEPADVPAAPATNGAPAPASSAPAAETLTQEVRPEPVTESSSAAKTPEPAVQPEPPKPVMPATPIARPKLPESTFVSIGTREEVLPAAAATKVPRASSFESGGKVVASADTEISDAIDALIAPSTPSKRTFPQAEQRGSEASAAPRSEYSPASRSAGAVSSFNPATEQVLPTPKQMFGVTLDSASRVPEKSSEREGSKAPMFIGIAAVLAMAAGGAYYYLHMRPTARASISTVVAAAPAVQNAVPQNSAAQNAIAQTPASNAPAVPLPAPNEVNASRPLVAEPPNGAVRESRPEQNLRATEPHEKTHEAEPFAPRHERASSVAAGEPKPQAQAERNVGIPSTFGALNTRPVIKAQSSSVGAAPALEPSGSPAPVGGALSDIAVAPPKLTAPPKPVSNAPVRVGGNILPPKLVSSVLPTYPSIAQQAGVTGTVVVDTTIDKEGRVEKMKVVSGPVLLRDAALNALRQWKYAPSKLNGRPISVEMIVSIQFNR